MINECIDNNNGGGNGGGGSSTGLIVGLAAGLGSLALIVVVGVILLALLFGWWRVFKHNRVTKLRSSSMVNFDPANEEDVESSSD